MLPKILEFAPAIAFFAAYKLSSDLILATGVIVGTGTAAFLLQYLLFHKVSRMQVFVTAAVILFGLPTVLLNDPEIIKWKITAVNLILAAAIFICQVVLKKNPFGYLFGQYKRLRDEFTGTLTGKGRDWGGSPLRPEATGYGVCYFAEEMLATRGDSFGRKTVAISGSGNVAQYACQKATALGAKVVTLSDSSGYIYDPEGISPEKFDYVMELKNIFRGRIREYADRYPSATYYPGERPWGVKCDIAMPCATQNELDGEDARKLVANGCRCVAEGANMPSTPEAIRTFQQHRLLYAPGKAANAGGVATSGLEMCQNSMRLAWTPEEVDARLRAIMHNIHSVCVQYGTEPDGYVNYVVGANIGGFMKVANAMLAQGCV